MMSTLWVGELAMMADRNGFTCMHCACQKGYLEVVKHLSAMTWGGELAMMADSNGLTCMYLACDLGHHEVVKHQYKMHMSVLSKNPLQPVHIH